MRQWFLQAEQTGAGAHHPTKPWWQVMCLTGVDYFSTLGYQPGIAALAAGLLSPLATLVLVLLTLFGALPVYRRVARESPFGQGSIAMLEKLLSWWQGKLLVLVLLGFVATDFVITITLSAADAAAHVVENPLVPPVVHHWQMPITLILITLLAVVFLKGFREAIGIAVVVTLSYLALNLVVVAVAIREITTHAYTWSDWIAALVAQHGSPWRMIALSLLLFPSLALGLSGFETGVAVMPLVKGNPTDTPLAPSGRIRNTGKLLTTAAVIMSIFLMTSSIATTLLIPQQEFLPSGDAYGRALSYLAHEFLGEAFGTVYDVSTILILWFAGASALAGLLTIVPRYLPRYGMAPSWTLATRPLVLVFFIICVVVTIIFRADVDAQGGAYATGVLVLITSAAFAVALAARRAKQRFWSVAFLAIFAVFAYTTAVNIYQRPDGVKIAACFIVAIIVVSLISRTIRSLELRTPRVNFDDASLAQLHRLSALGPIRIIANHPDERDGREYLLRESQERETSHIPIDAPVLFLEVVVDDPSEFEREVDVHLDEVEGFNVLVADAASVPTALAAVLLAIRDMTGKRPHAYLGWKEGNPLFYLSRFLFFGEGDIAPVTHAILKQAEPDPARRPAIHVG